MLIDLHERSRPGSVSDSERFRSKETKTKKLCCINIDRIATGSLQMEVILFVSLCVCACVRACVCVCACVCVRVF